MASFLPVGAPKALSDLPGLQSLALGALAASRAMSEIPNELVEHSLSYLDLRSLARASAVNRAWRTLIDADNELWKRVLTSLNPRITIPKGITPKQHAAYIAQFILLNSTEEMLKCVHALVAKTPFGQKGKWECRIMQNLDWHVKFEFFHSWESVIMEDARTIAPSLREKYLLPQALTTSVNNPQGRSFEQIHHVHHFSEVDRYSVFIRIFGSLPVWGREESVQDQIQEALTLGASRARRNYLEVE